MRHLSDRAGHFAQLPHCLNDPSHSGFDVLVCIEAAQAEPQAAAGRLVAQA
jgi:hypothetical protein